MADLHEWNLIMQPGYLKLARRTFSHYLWEEKRTLSKFEAWIDLLQLAAFLPTRRIIRGQVIEIGRGEVIASLRYLGERWNWKKDKVASFLGLIEQDQMVRRSTRHKETVVTICNYDKYNGTIDTEPDSKPDSKPDSRPTVARQSPDKVEEGKEGKEFFLPFALDGASPDPAPKVKIAWTKENGFCGITESDLAAWEKAYPAVNIDRNLAAAGEWLKSNPVKAKRSNWRRFITNWLSRTQEKGGDIASNGYAAIPPPPSFEEVAAYADKYGQPPEYAASFHDYATTNGWRTKTGPIMDWQAAFRQHCQFKEERYATR